MSESEVQIPRANAATFAYYAHEEKMAALTKSGEPSVSVEFDSTAKRETTPDVKVSAPLGCDLEALAKHAQEVVRIAGEAYRSASSMFPAQSGYVTNDAPSSNVTKQAQAAAAIARNRAKS